MPSEKNVENGKIHYIITGPEWKCEWIVRPVGTIQRNCYLTCDLDPMVSADDEKLKEVLSGLFIEVNSTVKQWIKEGDSNASVLLEPHTMPSYLLYAERILNKKFLID